MNKTLTPSQRTLAMLLVKKYRKDEADAQEAHKRDAARDRANGHRSHYCIHGTNQWTDYDNICGGCETYGDAAFGDPYARAIDDVRYAIAVTDRRAAEVRAFHAGHEAMKGGVHANKVSNALIEWMLEEYTLLTEMVK